MKSTRNEKPRAIRESLTRSGYGPINSKRKEHRTSQVKPQISTAPFLHFNLLCTVTFPTFHRSLHFTFFCTSPLSPYLHFTFSCTSPFLSHHLLWTSPFLHFNFSALHLFCTSPFSALMFRFVVTLTSDYLHFTFCACHVFCVSPYLHFTFSAHQLKGVQMTLRGAAVLAPQGALDRYCPLTSMQIS